MVDIVEVWNNPSCSRCAAARRTLDEARVPYRLRAYLDEPPTEAELTRVLERLGAQPWDICRLGEPAAGQLGLADWPRTAEHAPRWVAAMVAHPQLIQRPILLIDEDAAPDQRSAVVGRSPEALDEVVQRWQQK